MQSKLCILLLLVVCVSVSYALQCRKTCSRTERYTVKCGRWGWSRCTRYRQRTYTCYKPCPVNGGWSSWSSWKKVGACSVTCGKGRQQYAKTRTCSNPFPANGGKTCSGQKEYRFSFTCTQSPCPVHGEWSDWNDWSEVKECPVLCGGGRTDFQRSRTCSQHMYGGRPCEGDDTELREDHHCNTEECGDRCRDDRLTRIAHASDNSKFYECKDQVAYLTTCPVHSTFVARAEECVPLPCDAMNGLQVKEGDSRSFLVCLAGATIQLNCPKGSFFNEETMTCQ